MTNADGRTERPLARAATVSTRRLRAHVPRGDVLRAAGVALAEPPFLDEIVIRFGIAAAHGHYHVPLLLSPYGYSTYRGS